MLAYRHAFHAGNHADVLKHVVLAEVLRYMGTKDKAFSYIETHAGAGGYSLEGPYAQKKSEYRNGIERVMSAGAAPDAVAHYIDLVKAFNGDGPLTQYPGSPAIARMLLRPKDPMRLFELHPTDFKILESYLADRKHVTVQQADGFDALDKQLPPASRRAVVLIDPSYEVKSDYTRLVHTLRQAIKRFAEGVYLVWYPQIRSIEATQLAGRLASHAPHGWLHAQLTVQKSDEHGFGLMGSGMFVINPPYTLHDTLQATLPWLTETLAQYDGAHFALEHLPS